ALPGLVRVGRLDLDVYRSPTAWPRAFWTDRMVRCDSAAAYVARLRSGDGRPLAAVPTEAMALTPDRQAAGSFRAAEDFQLQTDRTSFRVRAPGSGWIVLLETYTEGGSTAIMNDHPAPIVRVNHAFQGIRVPAEGEYRITVRYRPRRFTLALALAGCGAVA